MGDFIPTRPDPAEEAVALRSLGAGFLAPARDAEAAVRAAIGGTKNRAAAWERLSTRGLTPNDWVEHPERRFVVEPMSAQKDRVAPGGVRVPIRLATFAHPPSIEGAVTLASDVEGVRKAEAYARELVGRYAALIPLAPWGGVLWRVLPSHSRYWPAESDPIESDLRFRLRTALLSAGDERSVRLLDARTDAGQEALGLGLADRFRALDARWVQARYGLFGVADDLRNAVRTTFAFEAAQTAGLILRDEPYPFNRRPVVDFRAVANPSVAKVGVYTCGYAFHQVRAHEGATWAVLVAPSIDDRAMPRATVRPSGRRRRPAGG